MIIRRATATDLHRIYQITFDSFGPYCAAEAIKQRCGIGDGIADKARSVREFCEQHLDRVFVAEEESRVVGYYSTWRQRPVEEVRRQRESDETLVAEGAEGPAGYSALAHAFGGQFGHVTYPCAGRGKGWTALRDQLLAYLLRKAKAAESIRIIDVDVAAASRQQV